MKSKKQQQQQVEWLFDFFLLIENEMNWIEFEQGWLIKEITLDLKMLSISTFFLSFYKLVQTFYFFSFFSIIKCNSKWNENRTQTYAK